MGALLNRFLAKYGGLEFSNVKYRPGAKFTCDFGFDSVFNKFRFHNAIDRGNFGPEPEKNPIYAPFDSYVTWIPDVQSFGSLLILATDYDFEVRIAHMDTIASTIQDLPTASKVSAGTYLGAAGTKGYSTGVHTHTEIVSTAGVTNELLDEVLELKFGDAYCTYFTTKDAVEYIQKNNLVLEDQTAEELWETYKKARGILSCNNYLCIRTDYRSGETRTFYNSKALFGF